MKILIINCSPVRNGATAEIVNIVKEMYCCARTIRYMRLLTNTSYSRDVLTFPPGLSAKGHKNTARPEDLTVSLIHIKFEFPKTHHSVIVFLLQIRSQPS